MAHCGLARAFHSRSRFGIIHGILKYRYLYQDSQNINCEGEIVAKNREDAYRLLRKQHIRPYRLIGNDPVNWRPWAVAGGYLVPLVALVVLGVISLMQARELKRFHHETMELTPEVM